MSKKELNISKNVMSEIKNGQIKMKPKWYFVLGSMFAVFGITALFITSSYLVSLIVFSLRTHGPMGQIRFDQLVSEFPLWAPIFAIIGIVLGVSMLKEYDFFYKNNFLVVIVGIISAIILAGVLMDYYSIDVLFAKKGFGRSVYERYGGRFQQNQNYNLENQGFRFKNRGGNLK